MRWIKQKQEKPLVLCGPAARLNVQNPSQKVELSPRVLSVKAAVGFRPPTQDKQKTEKSGQLLFIVKSKNECFTFFCFLLAAFEAGGNRPQPQGIRASVSRLGSQARR